MHAAPKGQAEQEIRTFHGKKRDGTQHRVLGVFSTGIVGYQQSGGCT
jgi:hypothetical protein